MQRDAIVFRTPGRNHWIQPKILHFSYLGRHMKFTAALYPNEKRHTQGLATKTNYDRFSLRTLLKRCCFYAPAKTVDTSYPPYRISRS